MIGYFINDLLEMTSKHLKDKTNIAIFSGHDTTLYPLLYIFGDSIDNWPPYASYLMIEYVGDNINDLQVRIIFNGKVIKNPIFENKNLISLNEFQSYLKQFFILKFFYFFSKK